MSKDIGENDAFFFNEKFTSRFYKVKIGTILARKESEPEKQETRQRVEEDSFLCWRPLACSSDLSNKMPEARGGSTRRKLAGFIAYEFQRKDPGFLLD
ncbi:hypothetical protein Nepgr_017151 [Nepenthes gracilis]|uniref:Uncharacterized protein n=1 Tax=Nepenthes gracilis TaxID=150966 RepID=A0AAD3SR19_NEPGR|nr:hypothetical protein Nepgr_017151 [Nepenthes gracilis]